MGQLDGLCAGHQLVVSGLILDLLHVLAGRKEQTGSHKGHVEQHVDLVEGQPVLDLAPEALEQHLTVVGVGIYHPAVFPAAVLFDQGNGGIKVAQGHQRLNAVLVALIKELLIEAQALFVGLRIIAVGQDAGPGNGQAVAAEAHLGKELDVLLEVVVHVNGFVGGVEVLGIAVQHLQLAQRHGEAVGAKGHHVHAGQAAPALVVSALALVGGSGTAPQKVFREFAHRSYLLMQLNSDDSMIPCSEPLSTGKVRL